MFAIMMASMENIRYTGLLEEAGCLLKELEELKCIGEKGLPLGEADKPAVWRIVTTYPLPRESFIPAHWDIINSILSDRVHPYLDSPAKHEHDIVRKLYDLAKAHGYHCDDGFQLPLQKYSKIVLECNDLEQLSQQLQDQARADKSSRSMVVNMLSMLWAEPPMDAVRTLVVKAITSIPQAAPRSVPGGPRSGGVG